jgi:hypothetical protein
LDYLLTNILNFCPSPLFTVAKRRVDNSERMVPVHYSTICKWELRSKDRQVAQSVLASVAGSIEGEPARKPG